MLACEGAIPQFDYALFADTGWEPRAVYANLKRLRAHARRFSIPVRTVSAGNIKTDALDPKHRFVSMPLHVLNTDGSKGLARRQCTSEYKIVPLKKAARQLLGYPHPKRVPTGVYAEQAIGISTDEVHRAKDADVRYLRNRFPLLELGWDRDTCVDYLATQGFGQTVKSACLGCLMWNLEELRCFFMITVHWEHFPLVSQHPEARRWLQFTANLGRSPNTVDAYGRSVEDHLAFCLTWGADPATARPDVVAGWIGDMLQRPNVRSGGIGLANATIQQRVIAVRSFYDFLVEEELRERNPVRRGQSSRHGGRAKQGLVRRVEKAPWIPNEPAWDRILRACEHEPVRNRLMVTFAYDGALRRQELVSLVAGDLEPAWSLIHLRAETTKSKRAREVSFGTTSAQLLVSYLRQRGQEFGRADGGLFLSHSRRNRGNPLGPASWSKIVAGIASQAGVPQLSTHTFRHLRLTDLARAGWTIDEIAQYAGHRDLSTTQKYIHLSGRELAAKMHKATRSLQADRERRLAALVEPW
ncbi:tyrosine-type recombinase/integrase [Saccharopolyspora spinosa]|uniref:tyrosine-type recombinase/integrase n=1 Tax=Saccharopolyspora spinosa TaxID=60894 RepID=UPI0002379EDD|nr:tyrosine-type recombinase/integrase [Saccharopolyspora spinosa]